MHRDTTTTAKAAKASLANDAADIENDVELENTAGIPPEMKRNFSLWSLLFMCCCTSTTWEALTSTMSQALSSGGSSSMVWGFFLSFFQYPHRNCFEHPQGPTRRLQACVARSDSHLVV